MWIVPLFSAFVQSNLYAFCLHFSNGVFTVVVLCLDVLLAVLCGTIQSPVVLQRPGPVVKMMLCSIGPVVFSTGYLMLRVQGTVKLYSSFSLKMNWPVWSFRSNFACFEDAFIGFLRLFTPSPNVWNNRALQSSSLDKTDWYAKCWSLKQGWNNFGVCRIMTYKVWLGRVGM